MEERFVIGMEGSSSKHTGSDERDHEDLQAAMSLMRISCSSAGIVIVTDLRILSWRAAFPGHTYNKQRNTCFVFTYNTSELFSINATINLMNLAVRNVTLGSSMSDVSKMSVAMVKTFYS
jgi:hypothetical protein